MKASDSIRYLKGVGERRAELFLQLGVADVGALLRLYPRTYIDRTEPLKLIEAPFDRPCCVKATVCTPVSTVFIRKNMVLYKFSINDGNDMADITLFNNKYLAEKINMGQSYLFYGQVTRTLFSCEMSSPEIYGTDEQTVMPIYPQTAGLSSKVIGGAVRSALNSCVLEDPLPLHMREKYGLMELNDALRAIHFPNSMGEIGSAKKRFVFEELFFLQSGILFKKSERAKTTDIIISGEPLGEFESMLPFSLTDAQKNAIKDCLKDMRSGRPMSRLVQGDVGSGKTMVAAALAFCTAKSGRQTVIMAPTEVLAAQHFKTFSKLFDDRNVSVALLTGSVTKSKKIGIKAAVESGETDVLIGTHAVLQDDVRFKKLGLVVTDEQHRFGVEQRTKLAKGGDPHMLVMSATPIPRTMSLIFYGDLDISIIDSLPLGRQPIETYLIGPDKRNRAYAYIKKHIDSGRQGYIICPAVEENEATDLAAATEYYEKLKAEDFKNYRLGLLHGKMKSKEKDAVMNDFSAGNIDLLVSTTVVEVGVDVPNAVIMLIENAERFGLSQLHQLRGRIGRGKYKSTCILLSSVKGGDTRQRLKFLCSTTDGFKIADEDLRQRGPGDFLGKRQHGLPELKIADLSEDMVLFRTAGLAAKELHETDPELSAPENRCLKNEISKMFHNAAMYGYN